MKPPIPAPAYKLSHAVLPYDLERSLPEPVIDNIYSFLRPARTARIERLKIRMNHMLSARHELLWKKKQRQDERRKHKEAVIAQLDKIIQTLEKLV
jgi:hypothetical protein